MLWTSAIWSTQFEEENGLPFDCSYRKATGARNSKKCIGSSTTFGRHCRLVQRLLNFGVVAFFWVDCALSYINLS